MSNFIPPNASKYLIESLNSRMLVLPSKELSDHLVEYYGGGWGTPGHGQAIIDQNKNEAEEAAKEKEKRKNKMFPGGMGVGGPKGKQKDISQTPDNILFGDVGDDDLGAGTAAGMYGLGKAAEAGADWLEALGMEKLVGPAAGALSSAASKVPVVGPIASAVGGGILGAIPGAGAKFLRQVSDISGANWFDANIAKIGRSSQELAAQGAGSPWTSLAIPQTKQTKVSYPDPGKRKAAAIQAAKAEESAKKLRAKGYYIP